jgi:hypothetical protein
LGYQHGLAATYDWLRIPDSSAVGPGATDFGSPRFCRGGDKSVRTNFYVDGWNLFSRALRGTPYRWLDLAALFRHALPDNEINRIRYFTSHVSGSDAPDKPARQQLYLRALGTTPNLTQHFGKFHRNRVGRALVAPPQTGSPIAQVWDIKEKGSDVNLTSMFIFDACRDDFDVAVLVSNDSDLLLPVELVVRELKRPRGILDPADNRSKSLASVASFYRRIHASDLSASQFPDAMTDRSGTFHRPASW